MSPILLSESQVPTSTMRLQCDANWATACSDRQERQRRFIASIYPTLSCNYQNGHSQKQLCTSKTNTDHLNILILTWDSPPKQLPIMALDANSPWSYHVQVTAGNANLTLPVPLQSASSTPKLFAHNIIVKWGKRPYPCNKPVTSQFISIRHGHFGGDGGTTAAIRQHTMIPHQHAIISISIIVKMSQEGAAIHKIK